MLWTLLRQTKSPERKAQEARKTSDAELARMSSDAKEVVELRKRQTASNLSVQDSNTDTSDGACQLPTNCTLTYFSPNVNSEMTAELKKDKAQLVQVTTEKLELSKKLEAAVAKSDKTLE